MKKVTVRFHLHINKKEVGKMSGTLNAYGMVTKVSAREFVTVISRERNFPSLKTQLEEWENWGFLTWSVGM
jgi:hypothetical protein